MGFGVGAMPESSPLVSRRKALGLIAGATAASFAAPRLLGGMEGAEGATHMPGTPTGGGAAK